MNNRFISHGPQALLDAVEQLLVVALREIGAADAAGKQHIADERALGFWRMKHHVALACGPGSAAR